MKAGIELKRRLTKIEQRLCGVAYQTKTDAGKIGDDLYSFEMFWMDEKGLVDYQPFTLSLDSNSGVVYKIHKNDTIVGYGTISDDINDYDRIASNESFSMCAGIALSEEKLLTVKIGWMQGWTTRDDFRPSPGIMLFDELVEKNYNENIALLAKNRGKVWSFHRIAELFGCDYGLDVVSMGEALTPLTDVYCNSPGCQYAYWFDQAYNLLKHVFGFEEKQKPRPKGTRIAPYAPREVNKEKPTSVKPPAKPVQLKRTPIEKPEREEDISLSDLVYSISKIEDKSFIGGLEDTLRDDCEEGKFDWFYEENGCIMVEGSGRDDAERFIRDALV